ncbi:hypothetical protein SAMN05192533_108103 [Mesobacillus persicus]|uniref:Small-conductance mechanosensitive channel n=1 Tax=Mesobacillus persicus TaxID=930146 RepID=A0A1H8D6V7_9BACI|nr:small-conductance mechanosensitive channel [Mesobacillus persicus]SEN03033.1 hypothetical protein SAMN05192533_108103 [Mesobacillus persicus]
MAISEEVLKSEELEVKATLEMNDFHEKSHFWGRLTISMVLVLTISLCFYLSFGLGLHPGWQPILAGFAAYAAIVGVAWVFEPISYYPTLGISGTYQAFLTGNISNMCLPAAAAAQNAIGAQPGTKKGEITAALAIAAASLINITILILIIMTGSYLLTIIPATVQEVFVYILPAIFGGIFAQFAIRKPLYGGIALGVAFLTNFLPMPAFFKGIICLIITIAICYKMEKMKSKKELTS